MTIVSLAIKGGPRYGIDFAGGTVVQVKFSSEIQPGDIKDALRGVNLGITSVQGFGEKGEHEFLIRAAESTQALESLSTTVKKRLDSAYPDNTSEEKTFGKKRCLPCTSLSSSLWYTFRADSN
jgi:preprotein translocase subunit SecF